MMNNKVAVAFIFTLGACFIVVKMKPNKIKAKYKGFEFSAEK